MKEQLLSTLANSRSYTLAVAEAMPANQYDTSPAPGAWTFGELLNHVAYGIQWWEDNFIKGKKVDWNPPAVTTGKEQVINYLGLAYASLQETVNKGDLTEKAITGFHATLDHITHHRGQAVLHLRCRGIAVPEYMY